MQRPRRSALLGSISTLFLLIATVACAFADRAPIARRSLPWPLQRDVAGRTAQLPKRAASSSTSTLEIPVAGCGAWTQLAADAEPLNRSNHQMIYDSVRDRLVVFGGYASSSSNQYANDLWVLGLTSPSSWTMLPASGPRPDPRTGPSAVLDAAHDRLIVFGGSSTAGPLLNDVWAYDFSTNTWTQLAPSGGPPAPVFGQSAIYDPVRQRMVVFGGYTGTDYSSEVWALSLNGPPAWTLLAAAGTGPAARELHTAIYDGPRDRMVMFGGYDGSGTLGDVWALALGTGAWTALAPSGTPPVPRALHGAIVDPPRDRMLVFGGWDGVVGDLNDLWSLSLSGSIKWTKLSPTGSQPPPANGLIAVNDSARQRLISFGGVGAASDELWAVNLSGSPAWTQLLPVGATPLQRQRHSAVFDGPRHRMVVFGGMDSGQSPLHDVWAFALNSGAGWTRLTPTGTGPIRARQSAALDSVRNRLIVFAGVDPFYNHPNDVWSLSLAVTPAWTKLNPSGTKPDGRIDASAIYDPGRDRMVFYGGLDSTGNYPLDEVWALSLSGSGSWSQLNAVGDSPGGGSGYVATYDRAHDRMLVVSGNGGTTHAWQLTFTGTPTWSSLVVPEEASTFATGPQCVIDPVRNRLLYFGYGYDVTALPLSGAPSWSYIGASPYLDQNDFATVVYDKDNDRFVRFGGQPYSANVPTADVQALSFPGTVFPIKLATSPIPAGFVNQDPNGNCFDQGTSITLTVSPIDGFTFTGWSGDASGAANPLVVTMNAAKNITAHFAQPPPSCAGWRRLLLETGELRMYLPAIVDDPIGHRLLALGLRAFDVGSDNNEVWQLPLTSGDADWQPLVISGSPPPFHNHPAAVFDPVRNRLLMYGGSYTDGIGNSHMSTELWALSLSGTPTWSLVAPEGAAVGGRQDAAVVYDSTRDRLLVVAGQSYPTGALLSSTWALLLTGPPTWTQVSSGGGGFAARYRHGAIYDPTGDRVVVYGGISSSNPTVHDTWVLTLAGSPTWTQLHPTGAPPTAFEGLAPALDPTRHRMLLYGGATSAGNFVSHDELFALALSGAPTWSQLASDGTVPGTLSQHAAAYDPDLDRLIVSNGNGSLGPSCNECIRFDTYALTLGPGNWLDLTVVPSNGGSIQRSPTDACLADGATVTLTATPANGNFFVGWSGDVSGNANPIDITMDGSKHVAATFADLAAVPPTTNAAPSASAIEALSPNPVALRLSLEFAVARAGPVRIGVYDITGREVAVVTDGWRAAGRYAMQWNANGGLAAGVYLVRLVAPDRSLTRRFVLVR